MTETCLARTLANFSYELTYDQIPQPVVQKAKDCILDHIGVSVAGSNTAIGEMMIDLIKDLGGRKEATVIRDGLAPCLNAALANGTLSHVHDMDDGNRFARGHPGATVIPAALSIAERFKSSGRDLITAVIAGYETFSRISIAMNPSHLKRGFHTTGTCGTFGAAVAASKLLGLDEEGITNALGIAGTQSAGLMEVFKGESRAKPLQAGKAAQSGVLAALLAEKGLTAPESILEGDKGFFRAFSDSFDPEKTIRGLGETFEIQKVYFKFYAACRHVHSAVDAALKLARDNSIRPDEVEKIHVGTYSIAFDLVGKEYHPKTESTAKFSLPYCLAAALTWGKLGPNEFTLQNIHDPKILKLAEKVQVEALTELDENMPKKMPSIVEITLTNGNKFIYRVDIPKGEPESPAEPTDLLEKFMTLAGGVISQRYAEDIVTCINNLEKIEDIKEITRLLRDRRKK